MKKLKTTIISILICISGIAQIDTISYNIYQNDGKLGIGINTPNSDLEIFGNGTDDDIISIQNNNYSRYAAYTFSNDQFSIPLFAGFRARGQINSPLNVEENDRITGLYGCMYVDGTYRVTSAMEMYSSENISSTSSPSFIMFGTTPKESNQRVERLRIDSEGNVGIGTEAPSSRLEIANGDIYINDIEKGIIMKSPDEQCWRGVLDNSGNLTFTKIDCPDISTTKVQDLKTMNKIIVYPNPTSEKITINVKNGDLKKVKYSICDINGKLIQQGKIKNNNQVLDISSFDPGVYLIKIDDKKGNLISTNKIIKN